MRHTRWQIRPDGITLFPNGILKILGIVFTLISIGFSAYFLITLSKYGNDIGFNAVFLSLLLLPGILLFLLSYTRIVFDDNDHNMKRYLFGFIKNKTVSYDDIAAIESYGGNAGLNYRVFLKENRHGKGISISSNYKSESDPAAMVFRRELIPLLEQKIKAGSNTSNQAATTPRYVTDFSYYKHAGSVYVVRESKIMSVIMGMLFIGFGISAMATGAGSHNAKTSDAFLITYFPVILGAVFLLTCLNKTILDKAERKIIQSYLGGIYKKEYYFGDFRRYLIVRKTTNLVYSGTDVRMELLPAGKVKTTTITIRNFNKTQKIERFIEETNAIMDHI